MQTRHEFLEEAREELKEEIERYGERGMATTFVSIEREYYEMVEKEVKKGNPITQAVYDSLTDGQKFHFTKHYNHRGDKIIG